MRNRDIQRWLKKNQKERGLSPRDNTGILDLTAFEAVKKIVADEQKELLKRYWESVKGNVPLSDKDADVIISILKTAKGDEDIKLPEKPDKELADTLKLDNGFSSSFNKEDGPVAKSAKK